MVKFALLARLEAKPGKEKEVENFLKSALPMAQEEKDTIEWFALKSVHLHLESLIRSITKREEKII